MLSSGGEDEEEPLAKLTDRELLRLIREHLDVDALLAAHPEVSRADLEAFWRRRGAGKPAAGRERELFDRPAPQASAPSRRLRLVARCDGAARGNPGPAAIGVLILGPKGAPLRKVGERIGRATSNVAEYAAVIRAAEEALALGATELTLLLDSELLVFQLRGTYKVRAAHLRPLHRRALGLLGQFRRWEVRHVSRDKNAAADRLANRALDAP